LACARIRVISASSPPSPMLTLADRRALPARVPSHIAMIAAPPVVTKVIGNVIACIMFGPPDYHRCRAWH
jgi:hypothetical protein